MVENREPLQGLYGVEDGQTLTEYEEGLVGGPHGAEKMTGETQGAQGDKWA
jgi:hypothetical protein